MSHDVVTLGFMAPPQGTPECVLGVIASRAPDEAEAALSVPAHALTTLNLSLGGGLTLMTRSEQRSLPAAFATGAQAQHRRYRLAQGAVLISALLRADALQAPLAQRSANAWLPARALFHTWTDTKAARANDWRVAAAAMMDCVVAFGHATHSADYTVMRRALQLLQTQTIADTAQSMGISERGLQRLFAQRWGLSPKRVQRMVRLQLGLQRWRAADSARPTTLTELAFDCGLSDQAHLAREFRELVGHAPRVLKSGAVELAPQMLVFRETWARFV